MQNTLSTVTEKRKFACDEPNCTWTFADNAHLNRYKLTHSKKGSIRYSDVRFQDPTTSTSAAFNDNQETTTSDQPTANTSANVAINAVMIYENDSDDNSNSDSDNQTWKDLVDGNIEFAESTIDEPAIEPIEVEDQSSIVVN